MKALESLLDTLSDNAEHHRMLTEGIKRQRSESEALVEELHVIMRDKGDLQNFLEVLADRRDG